MSEIGDQKTSASIDKNPIARDAIYQEEKNSILCEGERECGHPAVYLALPLYGAVTCPYCSHIYTRNH